MKMFQLLKPTKKLRRASESVLGSVSPDIISFKKGPKFPAGSHLASISTVTSPQPWAALNLDIFLVLLNPKIGCKFHCRNRDRKKSLRKGSCFMESKHENHKEIRNQDTKTQINENSFESSNLNKDGPIFEVEDDCNNNNCNASSCHDGTNQSTHDFGGSPGDEIDVSLGGSIPCQSTILIRGRNNDPIEMKLEKIREVRLMYVNACFIHIIYLCIYLFLNNNKIIIITFKVIIIIIIIIVITKLLF